MHHMTGIDRLQIKNFQCHSLLDIRFDPGVNSIVGPSDTGKSAVIRAIILAFTNEPKGEAYRKYGTEKTIVKATMFDKGTIKRVRTNTVNKYVFNGDDLKAVVKKETIPQEIAEYLHMDSVNYHAQHDRVFWFHETAGEVSRQLNRIVNLTVIDGTLYRLNSKLRTNGTAMTVNKSNLKRFEEEVEAFDFLVLYKEQATAMMAWFDVLKDTIRVAGLLDDMLRLIRTTEETIQTDEAALTHGHRALLYLDDLVELEKTRSRLVELGKAAAGHKKILKNAPPDFTPVEEAYETLTDIVVERDSLDMIIKTIEIGETAICLHQNSKKQSSEKLKRQFKNGCPLCGSIKT